MKIVYNIAGTYNSGGMERVLANKANFLAGEGHELLIVTTDQQGRQPYFALDKSIRCVDLDINYSLAQGRRLLGKSLRYLIKQRQHTRCLKKLLFDYQADIVISMFDHDVSFLHAIEDGSRKVAEIHFSRFKRLQYGRQGLWRLVDRWRSKRDVRLAKKYDRFVVLTHEDQTYWGELDNIMVIPNANSFEPKQTAMLENKNVIAVGRYDDQKAFEELLHIWKDVKAKQSDWSLSIFGDGPKKNELNDLINELDLNTVVTLCPPVKSIEEEYIKSSVLVMTSRYEGLPMALLEGQACGLPLIAYACKCGPRDVIREGQNGYLIAEGDRHGFAEKLLALLEDPILRKGMGDAARQASVDFSEDRVMARWLHLFEELILERRKR